MSGEWLRRPAWSWEPGASNEFVNGWVTPAQSMKPDVVLFGAPISRSSISVSGACHYPEAHRRMWPKFATYNLDKRVDLTALSVEDAGDVAMHTTDILLSHERIQQSARYLAETYAESVTCMIGGDHSTTACAVRGVKEAFPTERIGVIQLDTHLDVRDPAELGPANGTPIRQLIDGGTVHGEDVVNIGLHGYFNARSLVEYATEHGIQMVTLKQARQQGVAAAVCEALSALSEKTDRIYATIDMDVLDIAAAPGVPASTPGGMLPDELFEALVEIGRHPSVKHIDFVCLDPLKDSAEEQTVKTGVYAWLEFMTGVWMRK